jgi:hypothetical protein
VQKLTDRYVALVDDLLKKKTPRSWRSEITSWADFRGSVPQKTLTPEGARPSAATSPRHIAIIMDGNGRWAQKRGVPRLMGHRAGRESVREA